MSFDDDNWLDSDIPDTVIKRQNLISALIPGFISSGYTQTAARDAFRNAGFTFGNTFFSSAWSSIASGYRLSEAIRILDDDLPIPSNLFVPYDRPEQMNSRYMFVTRYSGTDENTGKTFTKTIRFDTDYVTNKLDLYERMTSFIAEKYPIADLDFSAFEIERAYYNEDYE